MTSCLLIHSARLCQSISALMVSQSTTTVFITHNQKRDARAMTALRVLFNLCYDWRPEDQRIGIICWSLFSHIRVQSLQASISGASRSPREGNSKMNTHANNYGVMKFSGFLDPELGSSANKQPSHCQPRRIRDKMLNGLESSVKIKWPRAD